MRDDTQCRAKVGLLFLRDCGGVAVDKCAVCGRALCKQHRVDAVTGSGYWCPECAAQKSDANVDEPSVARVRNRTSYYHDYHYIPYYSGMHRFYSDRDYRTFDDREQVTVDPEDVAADGGDFTDAMES